MVKGSVARAVRIIARRVFRLRKLRIRPKNSLDFFLTLC